MKSEAANEAVAVVGLRHAAVQDALLCLETRKDPSRMLVSAVKQLADDLDMEELRQQEEGECKQSAQPASAAFHQARAATCVASALAGNADEAIYEAMHATEDQSKVREIVLAILHQQ